MHRNGRSDGGGAVGGAAVCGNFKNRRGWGMRGMASAGVNYITKY